MRASLVGLLLALPLPAHAAALNCTFTLLCSPLTTCTDSPGVPFTFDIVAGALAFSTNGTQVVGTPLSHLTPPAFGALFAAGPDSTLMLTVAGGGDAVMTQTDIAPTGRLTSLSYFGTCAPDA